MSPKIGKCIWFTLQWILCYCSWRISEITSAVPRKAITGNYLTYVRSLWRTLCTKRCPHACTWCQRDGALVTALPGLGGNDRIFPTSYVQKASIWDWWCGSATLVHILCKPPADTSWLCGGTCTSCSAALPQLPDHHELAEWQFNEACPLQCLLRLHCPSSHTILGLISSGTKWSSLPGYPNPVHVVLDVAGAEFCIWDSHLMVLYNSWQTQGTAPLKLNVHFRAFLKL